MPIIEMFEGSLDYTLKAAPQPVLLAVVSQTCPHCHHAKPHLDALSQQYKGKVQTWALVAQHGGPRTAALSFEGVPAFYGFHRGELLWRDVGFANPARLAQMYEDLAHRATEPKGW